MMDLVHGLLAMNKKMREEHISFILKEVIQVNFVKRIDRILKWGFVTLQPFSDNRDFPVFSMPIAFIV